MNKTIIACDFSSEESLFKLLDEFSEPVYVKLGMEIIYKLGFGIIEKIKQRNHLIFLDLKLHDIPNTVYNAVKGLVKFDVDILTVHAAGGFEMLKGAKKAIIEVGAKTKIIAITQLTSTTEENMKKEQNIQSTIEESVLNYAKVAKESGVDGVVSSVLETSKLREQNGRGFIIINPGIRLEEDEKGDQKRVATPKVAKEMGASYIVVGRPITMDKNPLEKYKLIKNMFE